MNFKWRLLGGIVLVLLVILWLSRTLMSDEPLNAPPAQAMPTTVAQSAIAMSASALPNTPAQITAAQAASDLVNGEIIFERAATANTPAQQLQLSPRYGLGVWLPRFNVLRVLLLARPLAANQVAPVTAALANATTPILADDTYALLELRFQAIAQAFNRDELDAASLTVSNQSGVTVSADITGSILWRGSLPSAQTINSGIDSVALDLSASGRGQSSDAHSWQQSWQFGLAVPIALIE